MFMDQKTFKIVKVAVLLSLIYKFNTVLVKIPACIFGGINMLLLKFIWKSEGPRIATTILKQNTIGGPRPSDIKTCCSVVLA